MVDTIQEMTPSTRRNLGYGALIVAVVIAVFGGIIRHDFAGFDDAKCLCWNEHLGAPLWSNIAWYWVHPYMHLYTPLSFTVWNVLAAVGRTAPGGPARFTLNPAVFHSASLLLHAVNALLVFALVKQLVKREGSACLGAMLFALHPLQVETVAWASGLKDILYTTFSLISLWQYVISVQREDRKAYAVSIAATMLALLSKPAAVMIPVLAAVIDLGLLQSDTRRVARRLLPMFLLGGVMAVVGRWAQPSAQAELIGLAWRPLIALDALSFYLRKLVMPWGLAVAYGRNPAAALASGQLAWTWLVPVAVAAAAFTWRRGRPWLVVAVLLFALAPLPVLGWIRFDYQRLSTIADHYVYLAMIGPALLVAMIARNRSINTVVTCGLIALAIGSVAQLRSWQTNVAVWQRAVAISPNCLEAHENLGFAYQELGPGHETLQVREFAIASALNPERIRGHDLLSGALLAAGRTDDAITEMMTVMKLQEKLDSPGAKLPNDRLAAYLSLGDLLLAKGRASEAAQMFRKILQQLPQDPTARAHLEMCIYRLPGQRSTMASLGAGE